MEKIYFPLSFIISRNFSWSEVDFLYDKGWISFVEILDYAAWKFKSTTSLLIKNKITDLLISPLNEAEEIWKNFFSDLDRGKFSLDKIMVDIFSWLNEEELEKEKFLDIIEDIYCELNHLPELRMFIRYIPEDNKYRGSINTPIGLKERVSHYLDIKKEQCKLNIPFKEIDWI